MLDCHRFLRTWERLTGKPPPDDLFVALADSYAAPERAYHNAAHILDCLGELDACRACAVHPDEIEIALWFHDAVYDSRRADNEERSAAWASSALTASGAAQERVERVVALVLATKHTEPPGSTDAALLVDIDLSILGREPDVFDRYDFGIRREYAWVPEQTYRRERGGILRRFLARPRLFATDFFQHRYEAPARANLERALKRLEGSGA
ncbi:MAG: hypothetical protein U0793_19475 [Gemmataceae bacterium]